MLSESSGITLATSLFPNFTQSLFWCLLSQPVDLMGDTCKLAGTGHTLDPTWPHIPQFHPNDYNMSSLHNILKPRPPNLASCPVQHLPAGQDPAIIEHVQGSASLALVPGTHVPDLTNQLVDQGGSTEPSW